MLLNVAFSSSRFVILSLAVTVGINSSAIAMRREGKAFNPDELASASSRAHAPSRPSDFPPTPQHRQIPTLPPIDAEPAPVPAQQPAAVPGPMRPEDYQRFTGYSHITASSLASRHNKQEAEFVRASRRGRPSTTSQGRVAPRLAAKTQTTSTLGPVKPVRPLAPNPHLPSPTNRGRGTTQRTTLVDALPQLHKPAPPKTQNAVTGSAFLNGKPLKPTLKPVQGFASAPTSAPTPAPTSYLTYADLSVPSQHKGDSPINIDMGSLASTPVSAPTPAPQPVPPTGPATQTSSASKILKQPDRFTFATASSAARSINGGSPSVSPRVKASAANPNSRHGRTTARPTQRPEASAAESAAVSSTPHFVPSTPTSIDLLSPGSEQRWALSQQHKLFPPVKGSPPINLVDPYNLLIQEAKALLATIQPPTSVSDAQYPTELTAMLFELQGGDNYLRPLPAPYKCHLYLRQLTALKAASENSGTPIQSAIDKTKRIINGHLNTKKKQQTRTDPRQK